MTETDRRPWSTNYHPGWEPRLRNVGALPAGTGAKYLECLIVDSGILVAKSWHRKRPEPKHGYMVFSFRAPL